MTSSEFPRLHQTVLDARNVRRLAEFYRELLGYHYRPGDEVPDGPDTTTWLVLVDDGGAPRLAFQQDDDLTSPTWPAPQVPQQLHLDLQVADRSALHREAERASSLGARILLDRSEEPDEGVIVLADPEGHPFCIFTYAQMP